MGEALAPGIQVAGFTIERLLGAGGMGAVYLARDATLGRSIALKLVAPALADDERFRRRLLAESRLAAQLEHPGIVPVYAAGEDEGRLYLAMRYIPGGTLADRLDSGPLEPAEAAASLAPVADALDAAHAAGLVHRDVKPANILLDGARGMLADFGLARAVASPDSLSTDAGLSGTLSYVAPEQVEGDATDGRSDQYSLACVLFECVCGRPPFTRDTDVALIYAHLSERPPAASSVHPGLSPAVDAALARGLAKRPADRHPSCAALVEAVAAGATMPAAAAGRRRRGRLLAVAGAGVAVVAAGAVVLSTRTDDAHAVSLAAGDLATVDAGSGRVLSAFPVGQRPAAIAATPDGTWIAATDQDAVVRVDAKTGQVTQRVATGGPVNDLLLASGALWATVDLDRNLLRIDPTSGQISQRIGVGNSPGAIAATPGALWVTSRLDGTVSRIDPSTGTVTKTIPIGTGVTALAAAFGSVWATSEDQASITRIDAATGDVLDTIPVGHSPSALAATTSALWIANRTDGTVSRLDPARNAVAQTIPVGKAPAILHVAGDAVIVGDAETGDVYRIDAGAAVPRRILALGAAPTGLAGDGRSLLVTTTGLPSSHHGGTFVMADILTWMLLDPGVVNDNPTTLVWDTLVRYRRTAGSAGFDLVPDLAEAIPQPTDDGRTYVFHVRRGIRYSTGAEVRPEDFVLGVDRIFRGTWTAPDGQTFHSDQRYALGDLVGVEDCLGDDPKPTCDPSHAVDADNAAGTVTFHLARANENFLHGLAATAAPVPPGTPLQAPPDISVPGTGPYMVTTNDAHHAVYKRNSYFHVWSNAARPDGNPDVIDWLKDVPFLETDPGPTSPEIAMVESGKADSYYKTMSGAATERLLRLYPSQMHLTPSPGGGVIGFAFALDRPPFNSPDVRRAVSFAVDRSQMAKAAPWYTRAGCRTIGAGIPGYVPNCPYTTDHSPDGPPDLAHARELVRTAGAEGARVRIATWTKVDHAAQFWSIFTPMDKVLIDALRAIGLRPEVHRFAPEDGDAHDRYPADIFFVLGPGEGGFDGRDSLESATEGCQRHLDPGAFCDPATARLWKRNLALPDGATKTRAWTELDDHLVKQAAWLPVANQVNVVFLAKRVGNYGYQPAVGGSLWDRLTVR